MADSNKVKFYRGKNSSYKSAWEDSGHNLSRFKYAGCIYFAYDAGSLWLDGSNYGITGAEALDTAIIKVTYRAGDSDNPARLSFTPKDPNKDTTYVYLPHVSASDESITVAVNPSASSTEYKIGMNVKGVLNNLKLDLKYDRTTKTIYLIDKNGEIVGTPIDAADFVKDSFLNKAEYRMLVDEELPGMSAGKYLHMEFTTGEWDNGRLIDTSINDVYVNLTELSNYKGGKGIFIDEDNKINLSLSQAAETQQYLSIDDGSLALSGINKTFEDSSAWLANYAVSKVTELKNIIDNYTINDVSIGSSPTLDSDDIKMDYRNFVPGDVFNEDYIFNTNDTSTIVGAIKQGDSISTAFIKIQNRIESAISGDVSTMIKNEVGKLITAIGDSINPDDSSYLPRRNTNYINDRSSISDEIYALDQSLKDVTDNITKNYNDNGYNANSVVVRVDQNTNQINVQRSIIGNVVTGTINGSPEILDKNKTLAENLGIIDNTIKWNDV